MCLKGQRAYGETCGNFLADSGPFVRFFHFPIRVRIGGS
jgi:hypothetical protein